MQIFKRKSKHDTNHIYKLIYKYLYIYHIYKYFSALSLKIFENTDIYAPAFGVVVTSVIVQYKLNQV